MLRGYGHMVDFFTRIPWWTMNPDDDLIRQPDPPAVTPEPTHIVYTRDKQGLATLYLAGRTVANKTIPGDLSNWDTGFRFALANELSGDRPWLGDYHAVAVYDAVLSAKEVADRFRSGMNGNPVHRPLLQYTFHEGQGEVVRDVSGEGEPLNLKIENPHAVRWLPGGGLRVESPTRITSTAAAAKVVQAISRSGELTIEAWIRPANSAQKGPARIVTLSVDPSRRNFTLGQAAGDYEIRFRTSTTSPNGEPSLWSASRETHSGPNVSALRSATGDLAVLYFAHGGQAALNRSTLVDGLQAEWFNPRDGSRRSAEAIGSHTYRAPDEQDWVLLLRKP